MNKLSIEVLLGFDFGMKFIGVAVGQTVTQTSRALTTLKAKEGMPAWEQIDSLIKHWQPDAIIVGIPLNMDGTEQWTTLAAKKFAELLEERYKIPVFGIDERLSTISAKEQLFNEGGYKALKKDRIDSQAAQLILQSWLKQYDANK
jgi:putative Holliday junction resolvase